MFDTVLRNPWVQAAAAVAVLVLLVLFLRMLDFVLVPLFFAFILAYIFDPVADALERRRIPRMVTGLGLLAGLAMLLLSIPLLVLPSVFNEASHFISAAKTQLSTNRLLTRLPLEDFVTAVGWKTEGGTPAGDISTHLDEILRTQAMPFLRLHLSELANVGQVAGTSIWAFFSSLGRGFLSLVLVGGNLIFFIFMTVYLLKDFDRVVAVANELVPPRHRERTGEVMGKIDGQLRAFFRGQTTVCCCLGLMYTLGLLISGVPFALLIGLCGLMASFVPYVGPVVVVIPALLLSLLEGGSWGCYIGILITVGVAQALEGNVLTPRIVGSQVGLNPLWIILAVLTFGTALGFLGLLLAVPIAAVLKVLVGEAVTYYRRSPIFIGSGEGSDTTST